MREFHGLIGVIGVALLLATATVCTTSGGVEGMQEQQLSRESFERAVSFIHTTARPLERARFAYHFENGSRDAVIAELARFQNPDGGFQSVLESDTRWKGSSGLSAMKALKVFNEVGAPASDSHLQALVKYLVASFDEKSGYWHALPKEANNAPHAFWWDVKDDLGRSDVESPAFPTAALAGYLRAYASLLPPGFLDRVTASRLKYLEAQPVKMAMPDIDAFSVLVNHLPLADRGAVAQKLKAALAEETVVDPQKWTDYNIRPLTFVHSPDSPLSTGPTEAVKANLAYIIETQKPDGGWALTWSWAERDAAAWKLAEEEWRGVVTLENLEILEAFRRLSR